jgi:hypothetical protein
VALPILLYASEIWTLRKNDKNRLLSIEMRFFRKTAGYTLFGQKSNEKNLKVLKVDPVDEKLKRHKSSWLQHVIRMNNNKMLKIMLNYRPNGRRRFGSALIRLLGEAETALLRPNS